MELHQDLEENKCSRKQTGSSEQHFDDAHPEKHCRDMDTDQAISGENLDLCQEMEVIRCSVIQMHVSEQDFGGARPKEYRRDLCADQAIPGEKMEHCKDMKESKCSGIQIDSPEQLFGAHPEEYHTGMSPGQAIPDQDDVPKKYYAVAFPTEEFIITDCPVIYEQKIDALQEIRQHPGARFREFTSKSEALQYASSPYGTSQVPSSSLLQAYQMFENLSKQELVVFQKCIEDGDLTYFLELVWSKPCYLVNGSDYPTIIQEETQSNALHIAVILGQTKIFVQILHVLQDSQFASILYPKDELSSTQTRIRRLIGFYLNTKENMFSETPMQLACRFGHGDIVQIILTFSEGLLENTLNKDVEDIICQSHNCLLNHKRSMLHLFKEMYYVPIVQGEVRKYVDKPCDGLTVLAAMTTYPLKEGGPDMYCAFAGPAPLETAQQFYHNLKGNKYVFLKTPLNHAMASFQKRIEKDGRKLSKEYHIGWIEYWRSLDAWLDISSLKGLKFLEKHLYKLDIQINVLSDKHPLFIIDIIKDFIEESVVKISEIAVTCDKLSFFHELQTLVFLMNCFIKYTCSNETAISHIHEEVGHILFLKLTEDNHRNLENFHILKLLLLSQFSYVACYQKSMWKMFCCILRFASYFQQDSEFVVKPACQCDFAIVEDSYDYSSKSFYLELSSWRLNIINELVQKYEAVLENPLLEERETPVILLASDVIAAEKVHDDFAADICTLEQYIQLYAMDQVHMYKKYFFQSSTFIFAYCTLILNSYKVSGNFIGIFQDVIKSWEPICKLNYQQDIHLASIHCEMAFCLYVQFCHIPTEIVQWCGIHLKTEISSVVSTSHEWTHLMCVTSLLLTMLDGNKCDTPCNCHYYSDPAATKSFDPSNCIMLLRRLSKKLVNFKLRTSKSQVRSNLLDSKEEVERNQSSDNATPPDSFPRPKSIYVEGITFSDEDISIYQALAEARVDISKYLHIGKWKSLVQCKLANLQKDALAIKQIDCLLNYKPNF